MQPERQATVPLVAESTNDPRVRAVFDDIRRTKSIDFVPNLWRALAVNPDLLENTWSHLKRVMHPEAAECQSRLEPQVREMLALAVSATNNCSYCVNSHTTALLKLGVDRATLGEVMNVVALFNATNALADGFQVEPDVLPPLE
jgi:AhpD family alkylhydroperoxidase